MRTTAGIATIGINMSSLPFNRLYPARDRIYLPAEKKKRAWPWLVWALIPAAGVFWLVVPLCGAANPQLSRLITRRISAAEVRSYRVGLTRGECVRVSVDQKGVDVRILVSDPSGQEISDTDGFEFGLETTTFCAHSSGTYRVTIRPAQSHAPAGEYSLRIVNLRSGASDVEEWRRAERLSTEAKHLGSLGTSDALGRALNKSQQALAVWRNLNDEGAVVGTLIRLGEICYGMHDSGGVRYLTEAISLSRALKDVRSEGEAYNDVGMTEWQEDNPESALADLNNALGLWRSIRYSEGEAAALSNQAILLTQMGEYRQALNNYYQALSLITSMKDLNGEAFITNNIGAADRRLGEYSESSYYLTQAIRLFRRKHNTVAAARATLTLSRVDIDMGRLDEASQRAREALGVLEAARDRRWEADGRCVLADVYERRLRLSEALEYYSRSLAESQVLKYLWGEANALYGIGVVRYTDGELDSARQALLAALKIERQLDLPDREAATLYALAKVESKRGDLHQAALWAKSAINTTESLRANVPGDTFRSSFLATKLGPYSLCIDVLMRLHAQQPSGDFDKEAFEISEQARARSLIDMLREGHGEIRKGVPADLLNREQTLQHALDFESTRLLEATDSHDLVLERRIHNRRGALLGEYQEVEARIRAESPAYAALTQPITLTLSQIQRQVLLDDHTVLLEYELGGERSYGWAVTRTSILSWQIPGRSVVEQLGRRMMGLIREPQLSATDRKHLDHAELALSKMLISPVIAKFPNKRLLIVGDGILQSIPFGVLPTKTRNDGARSIPLIVNHEIIMLPSASTLAIVRREFDGRPEPQRTVAVLADPVFDSEDGRVKGPGLPITSAADSDFGGQFHRLLYSREEADEISALVPASMRMVALDFGASKKTVLSGKLAQYRIIHISTHGTLNQVHPDLSSLVFSLVDNRGQPQDGFLRLYDVYNLKLSADLVVLSACDTFLGGAVRGEGLVGLARGFMYAGAKSVVASLWSVDDESTAELMKRFYTNMLGPKRMMPAAALRAAQISMLGDSRLRPYEWAGFVIEGEW